MNPCVAFEPSTEETFLFWIELAGGQSRQGVYAQKLDSNGVRQWTENGIRILEPGDTECRDIVCLSHAGGACAFFVESRPDRQQLLWGAAVDANGNPLWTPAVRAVSASPAGKSRLAAVPGAGGAPILAWTDARDDEGDVFAHRVQLTEPTFVRGDPNADQRLDLTDAVFVLNHLFLGGVPPSCEKSADEDDNGILDITDAILHLNHLFLGGPPPEPPFPECGWDSIADDLTCWEFAPCR